VEDLKELGVAALGQRRKLLLSPQCRSVKPTPMRPTITAATAAKKVNRT
jgi:hypothetical protein